MIRVNKTRKKSKKDFIVVEKYVKRILGVDTRLYKIKLNNDYYLKLTPSPFTKTPIL